ncbi:MAG: PDZ domain-containing protein, partial [Planctomycetota bacterium]
SIAATPLRADVENPYLIEDPTEAQPDEEGEDGDGADEEPESDADASEEGESDEAADDEEEAEEEEDEDESLVIELEGLEARAMLLPVDSGRLSSPLGIDGGVAYLRLPRTGSSGDEPQLVWYSFEDDEEHLVIAGVSSVEPIADRSKLLVGKGGQYALISTASSQSFEDPIDFSGLAVRPDPRSEWRQMLVETWRLFRDFFYDAGMHGLDWDAVLERYLAALPDATSREDLHFLTGEMMAELNVGHAYNRQPPGGLRPSAPSAGVGLLGADWELDREAGAYRIARILGGATYDLDARSPLAAPGVEASAGDYLLAVNGVDVDPTLAVHAHLVGTAGRPTEIVLNSVPERNGEERTFVIEPLSSESSLRYRQWVADNRAMVAELSGGRIGYVHVPDTGRNGQNELFRQFLGAMHEDALIVDERWNGGGQIPTRFIELLDRPVTNYWAIRHGEDWTWPPVGHRGPKAMLINGWSGSGGDAFPWYFRQSELGELIGTRTWGGLVGISGNPALIDGTAHAIPRFAFYEQDGTWGVEGYGVAPDVE